MTIHHVRDGKLKKYERVAAQKEKKIEDFIEKHPSILEDGIFIIGRQVSTSTSGIIDLLGLDGNGNLVIAELKKGLPARKIVAQIIEYATWGEEQNQDTLNKIAKEHHLSKSDTLEKKFEKEFGTIPEPFNVYQRLFLVAESFDQKTIDMCRYLKRNGIGISCLEINFHQSGDHEVVDTNLVVGAEETKSEEFGGDTNYQRITWEELLEQKATKENKANVLKFISKVESKFGIKGKPYFGNYYFYTKTPYEKRNLFATISLRIDTCHVNFRIDPNTFDSTSYENGNHIRDVAGWWFRGHERRIKRTKQNDDLIFKCIEQAIDVTNKK